MKDINNSFQFQKITIVSHTEKSGKVLKIYPRTLIISKSNTIGKSTLLNCLFWGLGCEVRFEEDWAKLKVSTLIEFSVNNKIYSVKRDSENIYLLLEPDAKWIKFEKITGDYLDHLSNILNFNILLKSKNSHKLSKVPPAFYFSSTYIEQMYGWNEIWNSFENLNQFNKKDKLEVSKYLCSIQDKEFYENKLLKNTYEIHNVSIKDKIKDSNQVINFFDQFESDITTPLNEIQKTSYNYNQTEAKLRKNKKEYVSLSSKLASIENEINILSLAIEELEEDYLYSVENVENTLIYCPTCGVEHKNNLLNRFSIISDSDKLKTRLNHLEKEKIDLNRNLLSLSAEIEETCISFKDILNNDQLPNTFNQYLFNHSLKPTLEKRITDFDNNIKENRKSMRQIDSKNKSITKENLEKVERELLDYFNNLCKKLDAKMYEKNSLEDLLNHSSGGANQIKVMLAKRLTILKAIHSHAELATPPFIVDSLRQQDLDDLNYEKMLDILINNCPAETQLILAAVQNTFTNAIKNDFEEITIEDSLLSKEQYQIAAFLMADIDKNLII